MTMDNEVVDSGCKNCSFLRTDLDKKTEQWEKNKSQTLAGFLTLKQKIVGTDKLIQEYQSSKVECDILTRKNSEFVHLIDQLHRNLSTRNQEYSQIYGSIEQLKKVNADYEFKFKELQDEAQKWKFQAEAGENFTSQLVEKVKVLEKYEEEVKHTASVSRECERMESKVKLIKGQLKEAKEITNKSKKEMCKLQREYNLLVKYAKQWGKMIEKQGKFNTYQQKFYLKLCKEEEKDGDDVDQDVIDANETDEQSKLLEQLLGEGDGSSSVMAPTNILPSDMKVSEANSLSILTGSLQSPVKSLPCKQVKPTRTRAQKRGNQDNATPSVSPDKTPTSGLMTRNRTRTASQNSVNQLSTLSSDADTATESEKDSINKRSRSLTRSRSVKITTMSELKGPEPFSTFPDPIALPELIAEVPRHHKRAIDNIAELELMITNPIIMKPLVSSLEMEPAISPDDLVIPSISVIPNIQSHSQLNTTVNTNLLEFGSDSSSDSDMEMIPVPNCKFRTNSSEQDPSVLTDSITTFKTNFSGIFSKTCLKNSPAEELPHKTTPRIAKSCSIFALEADLDISSESEADAVESNQETTSIFSNSEVVVQASSFSLDEDHSSAVPESIFNRDLTAVLNVEKIQQIDGEVTLEKVNPESDSQIVNDKEETVNESRNDCGKTQEESSKPVEKSVNISQTETGMLKSIEEISEATVVVENEKEDREVAVVNVSKIMQTNLFDKARIDNSEVISEIQTQMHEVLETRPDVVENQSEKTFQQATDDIPGRLEVDLLQVTNLTASAGSPLEIAKSNELEGHIESLPIAAESEIEMEAAIVIPEQLAENLPTESVDSSPIESEIPKMLEKNLNTESIENQETLQNETGVDLQMETVPIDVSSIDTKMSKLLNSQETEKMVVDNENIKGFVNVSVFSHENIPMDSESESVTGDLTDESVDPLSTESLLVETNRQNQLEEIQDLHRPSVVVVEIDEVTVTEKLPKDSEIEVVATSHEGTRITEPFKEILETEPIADDNPDETPPVPLEKNTELVNASSDEDPLIEAEIPSLKRDDNSEESQSEQVDNSLYIPESGSISMNDQHGTEQSSKRNEEFESSGDNSEELQSEQVDNSLIPESGSKPKMLNDQHGTEQMVVVDKPEKELPHDEAKASCQKGEGRSIFDDVCELSVPKSLCKIPETKLTEENQRNCLVGEIIIEKPFSRDELVAAVAVDKLDLISTKDVDTFSSNTSLVMLGESNSMEDKVSEIAIVDETTKIPFWERNLSHDFPLETETPRYSATNFDKKSEKDLSDEDVIISMENSLEGQGQDVEELSNTNVKPIEDIQECQATVSDESKEETSNKTQVDQLTIADGVQSTKNISIQSGFSNSTKNYQAFGEEAIGNIEEEKLFDSNVDNPLQVMQDESNNTCWSKRTPKVAESLLQVEEDTNLPMPTEDNQEAVVNNQREKELPDEVEDFLDKPQQDQQPMGDNSVDPEETLKEESQLNITEPVGKNSKNDLEEFEVGKSANNKRLIEVEIEANPETESIKEIITSNDNQEVKSNLATESSSKVDVAPETISFFKAVQVPTMEETISQASQPVRPMISDQILERSQPIPSEKNRNPPLIRDAHRSLFDPPSIIQEPIFIKRNSSMLSSPRLSQIPHSSDHPSAFKVPRVPNTPPRVSEVKRGVPHGVKRSAVDDEVAVILKQIRTNIIELPTTLSPLPKSPEPQPIVPMKMEEPKSRFPVLPRCAFNWTAKKLPISDTLTERFGGYLHPGVQVRVRFRKVGRRLRDVTFPDIFSNRFHSVTNFAEAERRPKPILRSIPFVEDIADVVEPENKIPEPDLVSRLSVTDPKILSEKRPPLPNNLFSNEAVVNIDLETNPTSSIASKTKVTAPLSRSKAAIPDLFGSDSSSSESECESECESDVLSPNKERPLKTSPIQKRLTKPLTCRNPNEKQPEPGTSSGSQQSVFISSRAQALSQLVEPTIPLGRCDRSVIRRDLESPTTDQTRRGLGLGKGVKTSQHITISPCSESLLKLAKTPLSRVIAPLKRPFQQPQVLTSPLVTSLVLPDSSLPLNETPFKKRVSHTLKRGSEPEAMFDSLLPTSKRVRTHPETSPPAQSHSSPVPNNVESEVPISARTRQTFCSVKPNEMAKSVVKKVQPRKNKLKQKSTEKSPSKAMERHINLVPEDSTSESDSEIESMQLNADETGQSSSTEREERILKLNEAVNKDSSNEKGNPLQLPNNPQTWDVKKSCEPPKMTESPESPDFDVSPKSPDFYESPKSPDEKSLEDHEIPNSNSVVEIPTSSPTRSEQHSPSAFELVYKDILEASPTQPWYKQTKGTCKLKKEINSVVLKFFKNPEVINELLNSLVERVMRSDSLNAPFIFIRVLVTTVIRGWDDPIDLSHTPPAPPMAVVHQRCIILLQKLDEPNTKIQIEPNVNNSTFSDLYLRESQNIMFQTNSTLTLEEMCSLSRAYTAICRSRGSLAKARAFLFDCVYIMPPRSYALVHTIISVWADVLRQVSFPLGLSCVDHTIAYLLLNNCKVKAVQGISGKVKQTRSFLQNTYEYEKTTKTVDDLVDYLMTRFYETNSSDEASSISWSLFLLARWEGVDFAIQVIEKKLWPFLQRWSSGEYTDNSAAAVINAIGVLGKTVPSSKRTDVKKVLDAMKTLFQSEGVVPPIQEAAIETVIHLGEMEDPKSIVEMVKGWKIANTNLSKHMRLVLKAFIKRHSNLCVV